MALIKCPECGREISDRATACPNCGYPISQEVKSVVENFTPSENVVDQDKSAPETTNGFEQKETNFGADLCEQSSPPKKKKKLKVWQKILIGVGGFVAVLAILFVIFILIPAIKCVNAYEAIAPYLDYVGNPHPDEDEAITLSQEEYDNIDNVVFMGMKGEISFKVRDGYISSCTWTSFDYYSEEEYQTIAENLHLYFDTYPDIEQKSYSKGNTYRYYWTDPYYGFAVTMAHGFSSYDPEGEIEIKWETSEEACDILGHTWVDATCTTPMTCHVCGITEGESLGHQGLESSEWNVDYYEAENVQEYCCSICEETIKLKSEPITSFVDGNYFTIYPYAFSNRFEDQSSRLKNIDYRTKSKYAFDMPTYDEENYVYYRIQDKNDDYDDIGLISFTAPDGKGISVINDFSERCFNRITILIESSSDVSAIVYTSILAIDPSIDYGEAADVGQEIVDNIILGVDDAIYEGITHNGVTYLLCKDGRYHYLIITIA